MGVGGEERERQERGERERKRPRMKRREEGRVFMYFPLSRFWVGAGRTEVSICLTELEVWLEKTQSSLCKREH
jgi:hypothetical protein